MSDVADATADSNSPPGWLTVLRLGLAVLVGVLCVALPLLPGLAPWSAAVLVPGAIGYALVVGWPVSVVLHGAHRRGIGSAVVGGAASALFPFGLMALMQPLALPMLAIMGAIAGAIAWVVYQLQRLPDRWLKSRRLSAVVGLICAVALSLAAVGGTRFVLAVIAGPKDISCHNIGRSGGRSFPVLLTARFKLPPSDWPKFLTMLAQVAKQEGWSMRDYTSGKSLGVSMCQEAGTNLSIQQRTWTDPPERSVTIHITAPQGGDGWREPSERLLSRLASQWPGGVVIKGEQVPAEAQAGP